MLLWVSPKPGYAEGVQTVFPAIAAGILLAILLVRPRQGASAVPAEAGT